MGVMMVMMCGALWLHHGEAERHATPHAQGAAGGIHTNETTEGAQR